MSARQQISRRHHNPNQCYFTHRTCTHNRRCLEPATVFNVDQTGYHEIAGNCPTIATLLITGCTSKNYVVKS